jgi:parallel beta-helix repeat protein
MGRLALVLTSLLFASVSAGTIRVPEEQPTIQAALDQAASGDLVLVSDGAYTGAGNRDLDFKGKSIRLQSVNGSPVTVIDCQGAGRGFDFQSGEGAGAEVTGFTIRNGSADLGGAVRCAGGSSPAIKDCQISGNRASENGGGLACLGGSSPSLRGCVISGNSASLFGGGIYCEGSSPALDDCTLSGNGATSGGGLNCHTGSRPVLTGSTLSGNGAHYGGGMYCDDSSPTVRGCRFTGNSVLAGSAAFLLKSSPVLEGCVLAGNLSEGRGGGMCALEGSLPTLTNCLVVGNSADQGGALSGETSLDHPSFVNCTITLNEGRSGEGGLNCNNGAFPLLLNCILWGNSPDSLCGSASSSLTDDDPLFHRPGSFDFSRLVTATVGGEERQMPDFIVDLGDYRLDPGSPALDAGTAEGAPAVDRGGNPRPCGAEVDMGSEESCPDLRPHFLRGDANDDGRRDISDAGFNLNYLFLGGPAPDCLESLDVDDNGSLEISDPIFLLNYLFLGSRPLPEPHTACGVDPTPDGLGCEQGAGCSASAPR